MDVAALLADLEGLTHSARQKRMVDLGRASLEDASAKAILEAFGASEDAYVRALVVTSLHGSRDGALALRLLEDPSRFVRRCVSRLVALVCDDAQAALALLRSDTPRSRTKLAMTLRRRGRLELVDAFFAGAEASLSEDRALVDALPLASAAAVERSAALLESTGGPAAWSRLAILHPARFSSYAMDALGKDGRVRLQRDPRLRWRISAVAGAFAKRDPSAALALLRALLEGDEEPGSPIVRQLVPFALRKHPREVFDLLRARHERGAATRPPGAFGIVRFDKVAHRLGAERLAYVVEHAWSTLSDGKRAKRWFLRLTDGDRAAVIDAWLTRGGGGWGGFLLRSVPEDTPGTFARQKAYRRWSNESQSHEGIIPVTKLDSLPADLRHLEARRHLALPVLATRPDVRNAYASLLPFDEAKTTLASFLGHPEGEERAKAVRVLIGSVLHEPASVAPALATVRARKFEQDPVRLAMIDSLAGLPVRRFTAEHLEDVGAIVADALDAADCSFGTASAAERLVVRLFRIDASWGARWLTTILEKRGSISAIPGLVDQLLPADVDRLAPALVELATSWATRERSGALLWLSGSLGLRLKQVPALLDALERMAREQPFVGVTALALGLLRRYAPKRFGGLVPSLLAIDRSYAILEVVATFVSRSRQDLLTEIVGDTPMTGRFATGRTSWAIRFKHGHGRWTSHQQALHAAAWTRVLSDEKRDVPTLLDAIRALAALAFAPRDALLPFASDPRPAGSRDRHSRAAVARCGAGHPGAARLPRGQPGALGDLRAPQGLLGDEEGPRARLSPRRSHDQGDGREGGGSPAGRARGPRRLRRAGRDGSEARPPSRRAHRAAARGLGSPRARGDLADLRARGGRSDWVVASKLADIPLERLSVTAQDRVVALLVRILKRPEPEARLDLLRRLAYLPVTDASRTLLRALVKHLSTPRPTRR